MTRTVFTPDSNIVSFSIPDKYVGTELEITVFPLEEISITKQKEKETNGKKEEINDIDPSFGGWADMDKSTEEICAGIRNSRTFRERDLVL
jgi:hypothetical protein